MGTLPPTVGEGEYEQPLMQAILQNIRDLNIDNEQLKAAVYHTWELPVDSPYIQIPAEYKDHYSSDCRQKRGTDLGHQKG